MFLYSILVLALSVTTLAHQGHGRSPARRGHYRPQRRHNNETASRFNLTDLYKGQSFFECVKYFSSTTPFPDASSPCSGWDFFAFSDPTHGMVNFLDQGAAQSAGLAYVQEDGTAVLAVDSHTQLPVGANRNSYVLFGQCLHVAWSLNPHTVSASTLRKPSTLVYSSPTSMPCPLGALSGQPGGPWVQTGQKGAKSTSSRE
jgi:hypothetical protein